MTLIRKILDVLALLRKQPRTLEQLVDLTEMSPAAIKGYLQAARDEGFVYVLERRRVPRRGPRTPVFAWQPTPFEIPDAIYDRKDERRKSDAERRLSRTTTS